jgi:hypothetical protein
MQLEKVPLADWLAKTKGEVLTNVSVTVTVSTGPQMFYIVRFPEDEPPKRVTPR